MVYTFTNNPKWIKDIVYSYLHWRDTECIVVGPKNICLH
jgi:hypothetical protein